MPNCKSSSIFENLYRTYGAMFNLLQCLIYCNVLTTAMFNLAGAVYDSTSYDGELQRELTFFPPSNLYSTYGTIYYLDGAVYDGELLKTHDCQLRHGEVLFYTHTLTHTHKCTHKHTHTNAHTHTHTQTQRHAHTHAHTHSHTQTHTCTHVHAHTHA